MRLKQLGIRGFRNLAPQSLDTDAPMVAFVGENGQGKTNLLEAIGVLGTLRSFRSPRIQEILAWGEVNATVEAQVSSEGMDRAYRWAQLDGVRSLRREERTVDAVSWLSSLRASYFVPGDTSFIRGEPALRRALLDRAVLTCEPSYLHTAHTWRKLLTHKSAALRNPAISSLELDVLDDSLAETGAKLTAARARTVEALLPHFKRFYQAFAPGEAAGLRYRPAIQEGSGSLAEQYRQQLQQGRATERAQGRPLYGPHRDDLLFHVDGRSARAYASQGQIRSLVLAWKIAELEAARVGEEVPLFLLDDLGSELDPERTLRLVELLRSIGAQIFLTTTDLRFLPKLDGSEKIYRIKAGNAEASILPPMPPPPAAAAAGRIRDPGCQPSEDQGEA